MGQRHQFWIIARIHNRYRVVAALHHQWAYGTLPIKACWRLLRLLQNPNNKRLAQHELDAAASAEASPDGGDGWWQKEGKSWDELESLDEFARFPFLMTCLLLAASFDPRPSAAVTSASRASPMSMLTDFTMVDNDDGFTLIDITDIDNTTYCLMQVQNWFEYEDEYEMDQASASEEYRPTASTTVGPFTPMNDLEYLAYYYGDRPYSPSLAAWDVIDASVLRELWPQGTWYDRAAIVPSAAEGVCDEQHQRPTTNNHQSAAFTIPASLAVSSQHPSLSDVALRKVLDTALDDADMEKMLDAVESIPGLAGRLLQHLTDAPELVYRPGGARLLGTALRAKTPDGACNLSRWTRLTSDDVLHVVEQVVAFHEREITLIDISNNSNVSAKCVGALAELCPHMDTLVALNTPNLPLADLLKALRAHSDQKQMENKEKTSTTPCQVWHTDLFKAAFSTCGEVKPPVTEDNLHCPGTPALAEMESITARHVRSLNTVTQIFYYQGVPWRDRPNAPPGGVPVPGDNHDNNGSEHGLPALNWRDAAALMDEGRLGLRGSFGGTPCVRCIPVSDALLQPQRATEWFCQLFQMVLHHNSVRRQLTPDAICRNLALALSVGVVDPWRVFPIPVNAFTYAEIRESNRAAAPPFQPLEPGSWTLMAFHDVVDKEDPSPHNKDVGSAQYAFVTVNADGKFIVADLDDFLKETTVTTSDADGQGDRLDPALAKLVAKIGQSGHFDGDEEGQLVNYAAPPPADGSILNIDWTKLRPFSEKEAVDVLEKFVPMYEKERERGLAEERARWCR